MNLIASFRLIILVFIGQLVSLVCPVPVYAHADSLYTFDKLSVWNTNATSNFPIHSLSDQEKILLDSAKVRSAAELVFLLYQDAGEYYLKFPCTMAIFKWSGKSWVRFSGRTLTGICAAYHFFRDGELYQLGNSGYWQEQEDLFHFNSNGDMNFISTKNQPLDFQGYFKFTVQDGLFSLFGHEFNLRTDKNQVLMEGFFLHYKSMTWKKIDIHLDEQFKSYFQTSSLKEGITGGGSFETKDYVVIELGNWDKQKFAWLIVDKKTLSIYLKPVPIFYHPNQNWIRIKKNTISLEMGMQSEPLLFQLDQLVLTLPKVGRLEVLEDSFWEDIIEEYSTLLWSIPLSFLMFGLLWKGLNSRFSKDEITSWPMEVEDGVSEEVGVWLQNLEVHSGKTISQDTMDELLGIGSIKNPDVRKAKRSRSIRDLNKLCEKNLGYPIIHRVRKEEDKRIIGYRIGQFSKIITRNTPPGIN
jgi:hypothetical protein